MSEVHNDQNIILALLNVNLSLISTVDNINSNLPMSSSLDRLIPQVHTKNIFENCRSALDYMAYLIVKTYNIDILEHKIQFPIHKTEKRFKKDPMCNFLQSTNASLYEILKEVQPFNNTVEYEWLDRFNDMNNKYKHRGFIPLDARFDTKNGGWVSMSHGASLGRFTLDITNGSTTTTDLENDRTNKFRFVFTDNNEELIPFLRKVTDETYKLIFEKIWKNGPTSPIEKCN